MVKVGLATNLVGKRIKPIPEWGDCNNEHDPNGRIWAELKPTLSGQYTAEIDAAWTEEGSVKLAVHDPFGNTAEVWLKTVSIHID